MNLRIATLAAAAVWSVGCSGPDLPDSWEHAESVTSFTQAQCGGSAGAPGGPSETVEVVAGVGAVRVAYHAAQFRCAQTVEGFSRRGPSSVDFLVQPRDMHPKEVAGCDCLYEITMSAPAPSGHTAVTIYRRGTVTTPPTGCLELFLAIAAQHGPHRTHAVGDIGAGAGVGVHARERA
ncbi:MAG TPA: hypothetical protein VGY54_19645 [Polyangiaceae bacterium]|nr:hypothetical protein [Polyangiaceae bacterium]